MRPISSKHTEARFLLLIFLFCVCSTGTAEAREPGTPYRFVGNDNLPPIIYREDGKPAGLAVDLVQAVAEKAGISIRIEAMNWPTAQTQVLAGEADALLQINRDPEREALYDFSDVLLTSNFHLFRNNLRPEIHDLASLRGKTVGVEAGGFPARFLRRHSQIRLKFIPDWKTGFDLLQRNEVDALFTDRWVGEYQLFRQKIQGVTVVEPAIVTDYTHLAVKKGNQALLDRINFGLHAISGDGTREAIEKRWQTQEIVYLTREARDRLIHYATWAALAILALITLKALGHHRATQKINRELQARSRALANENEERKRVEAALRQVHATLEQRVAERTAELQAANNELRESEARLHLALDAAFVLSFEWDIQNDQVHRLVSSYPGLEVSPELAPLSFEDICGVIHSEDRAQFISQVHAAMAREDGQYENEYRMLNPDGQTVWLHDLGRVERDAQGQPTRLIGLSQDVTRSKQVEDQLRCRLEELRQANEDLALFNTAAVGRELRMIELKQEINELCLQAGQSPRYELDLITAPSVSG